MPTNKALVVLQENSGSTPFDDSVPPSVRPLIQNMIDGLAETFEDIKTRLQGTGRYDVVHLLTDNACSRPRLLGALMDETRRGRTVDLIVLGHGSPERLLLKHPPHLEGDTGNRSIQDLLTDAREQGLQRLNLRMVFMCNCYGSTVNDDWIGIGAKVSIGSRAINVMPEPMTTYFVHNWLAGQKAKDAAKNAYEQSTLLYVPFFPPTKRIKYKNVEATYPCPTWDDLLKMCKRTVQVPDGVELVTNTHLKQSELLVAGDVKAKF